MLKSILLDADVIKKTLLLAAMSTVGAVIIVGGSYYAIYGVDGRFGSAMRFALFVPFFCSFPIGLVIHSQGKRLERLNAELQSATEAAEALNLRLMHEASHDAMTGILNRKYFLAELTAGCEDDSPDSLLLIDADRFKAINDRFGHHTGDEALIRMTKLITKHLQPDDVVGRIGGEEFAVLLKDQTIGEAWVVAEQIRSAIYTENFLADEGQRCQLSVSIGVNRVDQTDRRFPFRKVDLALYEAKSLGRNRTVKFEPEMDIPTSERYGSVPDAAAG